MTDLMKFEVNSEQREILLRGLRYVRSQIKLSAADPSEMVTEQRKTELRKVADLAAILEGGVVAQEAVV